MIPIILPDDPEEDGLYCAGKRYIFRAFCDADYVEWDLVLAPPGITIADIRQTTPNGKVNFVTLPVPGDYWFTVRCCKKV